MIISLNSLISNILVAFVVAATAVAVAGGVVVVAFVVVVFIVGLVVGAFVVGRCVVVGYCANAKEIILGKYGIFITKRLLFKMYNIRTMDWQKKK